MVLNNLTKFYNEVRLLECGNYYTFRLGWGRGKGVMAVSVLPTQIQRRISSLG